MERRLDWKAWRKRQRISPEGQPITVFRDHQRMSARAGQRIEMPGTFCLDRNPDETIAFLEMMRARVLRHAMAARVAVKRRNRAGPPFVESYFDFGAMKELGVSAALILAALFDRQKMITGWRLATIDEHLWEPSVRALLWALGFHELLKMHPEGEHTLNVGNVRVLRFVSGDNADGSLAGQLQETLAELLPDEEGQKLLYAEPYGGIFEAILNSWNWAYPEGHHWEVPPLKKWWMTGAVDLSRNSVSIVVYDQGVTIPFSLPQWRHWGELQARLQRLANRLGFAGPPDDPRNDGAAIALATKIARSRTNLPQHGKGLHTMREVAERARHGRLRILSRHGEYVWERGRKPVVRSRDAAVRGTLIEWTLDL